MAHILGRLVDTLSVLGCIASFFYYVFCLSSARAFLRASKRPAHSCSGAILPPVSILKPLKGIDPEIYESFRSHCLQDYPAEYEIVFGVSDPADPAVASVELLQREFPEQSIRLIVCPERLGTNGKVSTLAQLIPHARYDYLLINDSDITVSPRYLTRVMAEFQGQRDKGTKGQKTVGLVTALYRGRPHGSLWSKLEALGIATDFQPSVLLARWIEGGLRYGLGSTLAVSREALAAIGGIETLADPAVRSRLIDLGQEIFLPEQQTPAALGALNKADIKKWWPIIRAAGLTTDAAK